MQTTAINIDYKSLYEASHLKVIKLEQELAQLKKMMFGPKHDRFVPTDINKSQLQLDIEAEVVAACSVTGAKRITYVKTTTEVDKNISHPGRMKLPDYLRREEITIEPKEDVTGLKKIGEDITEILDYLPGELFVNRIIRPKYAKPGNTGVIMSPLPSRALEKHLFGEGLLTQILIDKYVDHLPLHRQIERFKRQGVTIAPSTMSDAVRSVCNLIDSLGKAHLQEVLATHYLGVDETPIKVQDRDKKGTTHRGYFWVYHNNIMKLVLFDYREGRGREGPMEMLKDFTGHLQCDGYSAYDIFEKKTDVILLNCMAHARRKFIDAQDNDIARAEYVLDEMQKLYAIEKEIKDLSFDERKQIRQQKAVPILQQLGQWMTQQYTESVSRQNDITSGSTISEALCYSIKRWDKLSRYTENGILNIDNNPVENSIRPVALGRKNYLFCGSHEAARRTAMLYSLFGTCKLHGLEPYAWLKEVLAILPNHPINRIKELLPQNWKK